MTPRHVAPTLVLLIAVMAALSVPTTVTALPMECWDCTYATDCYALCSVGFKVQTCGDYGVCDRSTIPTSVDFSSFDAAADLSSVDAAVGMDASTALFPEGCTAPASAETETETETPTAP